MHRRADVMGEAWQRQLLGPTAPAGALGSLIYLDGESGAGQRQRGGQAIRPRADDHGVGSAPSSFYRAHSSITAPCTTKIACESARAAPQSIERPVGTIGSVAKAHLRARAEQPAKLDSVLGAGVFEAPFRGELQSDELCVVDKDICLHRKLERIDHFQKSAFGRAPSNQPSPSPDYHWPSQKTAARGRLPSPSTYDAVLEVGDSWGLDRAKLLKFKPVEVVEQSLAASQQERDDR